MTKADQYKKDTADSVFYDSDDGEHNVRLAWVTEDGELAFNSENLRSLDAENAARFEEWVHHWFGAEK